MSFYPHTPAEDHSTWWDLSCDIAHGMIELGWNEFGRLPGLRMLAPAIRRRARYVDTWMHYEKPFRETLRSMVETWCFEGEWPEMGEEERFLLILRCFVVCDQITMICGGPGKTGETFIPFPRHVAPPVLRRWWLTDWFEGAGEDILHQRMMVEYWMRGTTALSPSARRIGAELRKGARRRGSQG
jgi:hypothetical protein